MKINHKKPGLMLEKSEISGAILRKGFEVYGRDLCAAIIQNGRD